MKIDKLIRKSKLLTENEVLNKLGILDFARITPATLKTFSGMLADIDPEVAKAAIAQFPEFATTAREVLADYREAGLKVLDASSEGVGYCYKICEKEIDALDRLLEDERLSIEQKVWVVSEMRDIEQKMFAKDSEHKRHRESVLATVGKVGFTVVGLVGLVLYGKNGFKGTRV